MTWTSGRRRRRRSGRVIMASPAKVPKMEIDDEESVAGYIHNVTQVKIAARSRNKYFNAIIQCSREKFHRVVVFSAEKHDMFVQAEKNRTSVRLRNIRRCVSSDGGDFDVQCGRSTVMVVSQVTFTVKDPPEKAKKTVAAILAMAPKQQIGSLEAKVIHVNGSTETVECRGVQTELQTCHVQDSSGIIKVQLWEGQVGSLLKDHSYTLTNLSTREFAGHLFLTTTQRTEIRETEALRGLSSNVTFHVSEAEVCTVVGTVNAVEFQVKRKCGKCQAWQNGFDSKGQFHRCQRCNFLQKCATFMPTASGKMTIDGDDHEQEVSVSNSCLKKYLEAEGLVSLLQDRQDLEEHFLLVGELKLSKQGNAISSIERAVPQPCEVGVEDQRGAEAAGSAETEGRGKTHPGGKNARGDGSVARGNEKNGKKHGGASGSK